MRFRTTGDRRARTWGSALLASGIALTLVLPLGTGVPAAAEDVIAEVGNVPPTAGDDSATVASRAGDTVTIEVLANDSDTDGGTLVVESVDEPLHGIASAEAGTTVAYDPVDDYVGLDEFTYVVSDGQGGVATGLVTITVTDATTPMLLNPDVLAATAGIPATVDVLANDDAGGRDPLTLVSAGATASGTTASGATVTLDPDGRSVTYTAPATFAGPDGFEYTVRDRLGNLGTGRVDVTVTAPADPQPPPPPPPPVTEPVPTEPVPPVVEPPPPPVTIPTGADISVSGPLTRRDVPYSYRPGCPVKPSSLRRLTMNYWDYRGVVRRGTLIVRLDAVADMSHVFTEAFDKGFRIKKMKPADAYYKKGRRSPTASDRAAMAAGNTSAFNCRPVVGNPTKRSAHSYGVAIDINTFENPYVVGSGFYPRGAGKYLRRAPCRTGMICPGGTVATAMRQRGWLWGARWSRPDYQHFSANGG